MKISKGTAAFISFIIIAVFSTVANAGGYAVVGATSIETDITEHSGVMAGFGVKANDFLSAELTALVSSSEENYQGVDLSWNYFYNFSLIGSIPLNDSLSFYGKLGYTSAEAEASYMGYTETASDTSESYGFGVKYDVMESYSVRVEYNQYYTDISAPLTAHLQINF